MNNFFERLPIEAATEMEQMSRLMYELRENRKRLLDGYQVANEAELLAKIVAGSVPEHPAYDHYLGALTIAEARDAVNVELKKLLAALGG